MFRQWAALARSFLGERFNGPQHGRVSEQGWKRLGRAILHDRIRYWPTREEFAQATGLSARLLDDLEAGRRSNYSDATYAAIEATLGWREGTCLRVVDGGRVFREYDPAMARIMRAWPHLSREVQEMLADLADRYRR